MRVLSFLAAALVSVALGQVDNTPIDRTLFVPEVTRLLNREFETIVEFTPGHKSQNGELNLPDRVESFLIEFGPVTQNFPFVIRQVRPIGQMQLTDEGILNRGRIFSIGKSRDGKSVVKSQASKTFFFKSNSAEVNKIREQVVFFDDFNGDAGDFDERRWNVAFSVCSLAKTANFPVNNQKHIHTQVGAFNLDCPEDVLTARTRAVFDFTDRTGKVFLDHDGGSFVGHEFFLDVSEEGAADVVLGADEKNVIRVKIDNSQLEVQQILPNGETVVLPGSVQNLFPRGDETYSVTNVRRPWVMEINDQEMSLDINGIRVLDKIQFQEPLSFTKANIVLTHRGVQSLQQGHHAVTMHLDNIGFDGPEPKLQTLNYRNVQQKQFQQASSNGDFTVKVPEDDTNTVDGTARLQFTSYLQTEFENNVVTLNGRQIAIPTPSKLPSNVLQPVTTVIEVDASEVAGKTNQIVFGSQNTGFFGNVHIEMDFGCQAGVEKDEREFTVPVSQGIFASSFPISFNCDLEILARPVLEIKTINGKDPVASSFDISSIRRGRRRIQVATGAIVVDMFTDRQLRHNGGSNGLKTLEVLVDCKVVQSIELDGASFQLLDFKLDVTVFGSGTKDVFLRAVDNLGRSSTLGLDTQVGRGLEEEIYNPLLVQLPGNKRNQAIDCPDEVVFIGGDCEDNPVFTKGIQALSVCDDVPTENLEFVRAFNPPKALPRKPTPVRRTGRGRGRRGLLEEHVPSRAEITSSNYIRRMGGYVGDWDGQGWDVPTFVDPTAPAYNASECDVNVFEACKDGPLERAPEAAWGLKGSGPNGIKYWIERPVSGKFELDNVGPALDNALKTTEYAAKASVSAGEALEKNNNLEVGGSSSVAPSYLPMALALIVAIAFQM